jgi:hypothetical protein
MMWRNHTVEWVSVDALQVGDRILDDQKLDRCTYIGLITSIGKAQGREGPWVSITWMKWADESFPGYLWDHQHVWRITQ